MREVKFRVYDSTDGMSLDLNLGGASVAMCLYRRNGILLQYTGLKDKNGKEIYEGDIIQELYCTGNCVVKFGLYDNGQHYEDAFSGNGFYTEGIEGDLGSLEYGDGREVIGNIYENPELLEVPK